MTCQLGPNFLSRTSWKNYLFRMCQINFDSSYFDVFGTKFVVGSVVVASSVANFHHFFFHVLVHICISDHGELVATNWGDIRVCHCAPIFLKQEDLAPLEICYFCAPVQTKLPM